MSPTRLIEPQGIIKKGRATCPTLIRSEQL